MYDEVKKLAEMKKLYIQFITNGCIMRESYSDGERRVTNVAQLRKDPKTVLKYIKSPKKMKELVSDSTVFVKRKMRKKNIKS